MDQNYLQSIEEHGYIFIDIAGNKVPYAVSYYYEGDPVQIKLKGIDTPEQARNLISKGIFLSNIELPDGLLNDKESPAYYQFVGMIMRDINLGTIGKVMRIEEFPQQIMAIVGEAEYLIPLNDTFVQGIEEDANEIIVDLPEGLVSDESE